MEISNEQVVAVVCFMFALLVAGAKWVDSIRCKQFDELKNRCDGLESKLDKCESRHDELQRLNFSLQAKFELMEAFNPAQMVTQFTEAVKALLKAKE